MVDQLRRVSEGARLSGADRYHAPPRGEYVLSDSPADFHPEAADDVWMLVAVGGQERARGEFTGLFADAGWSVSGIREDPRTRGSFIDCHPAA